MAEYDTRLQQVFDAMALSRSGRKPELNNMGVEYERLMTFVRQTEYHLTQAIKLIPESLPENTGHTINQLMPEFSAALIQYDNDFRHIFTLLEGELQKAEIARKS